jgi:hypothetical protein
LCTTPQRGKGRNAQSARSAHPTRTNNAIADFNKRNPRLQSRSITFNAAAAHRQHAEAALDAAPEHVSGSLRTDADQVAIELNWEVPSEAGAPIVFQVRISRNGRESSIRFAIDLNQLQTDDLQILHDLLAYPPKSYWLARAVAWLVDTSLRQQQPHWNDEQRNQKAREMLLAPP